MQRVEQNDEQQWSQRAALTQAALHVKVKKKNKIDGHAVTPVAHNVAIRYLGVHCRFDGGWTAQHAKSTAMIQLFTRAVCKFNLPVSQAAYMFNVFLLPKLELALRYITGPMVNTWIEQYDAALIGSMQLLLQLFPPPPLIPQLQHSAHVLCGVFCASAANAACRQLGMTHPERPAPAHA